MYSIYNVITGQIKRHSESADIGNGEGVLPGKVDPQKFYVRQGQAIPIPPKPYANTVFDFLLERWVDVAGQNVRGLIAERNLRLQQSDWTDTASFRQRMGDQVADAWLDYRQQLRDVTDLPGFPMDFAWPEPPK